MTYREHLEEGLRRCTNLSQDTITKAFAAAAPNLPMLDEEYVALDEEHDRPAGVRLLLYWECLKHEIRILQSHHLN